MTLNDPIQLNEAPLPDTPTPYLIYQCGCGLFYALHEVQIMHDCPVCHRTNSVTGIETFSTEFTAKIRRDYLNYSYFRQMNRKYHPMKGTANLVTNVAAKSE